MDSKSISRKGVGVRLPSLAPAAGARDEVGEAAREVALLLVPHLLAEVRACTRRLEQLVRALHDEPASLAREDLAQADEDSRTRAHRAGWLLAVLGAAGDGERLDLVRGRCERDGLRWMLTAVASARGIELEPTADRLPELGARTSAAAPVLAAWCVVQTETTGVLRWQELTRGIAFELRTRHVGAELERRCARLAAAATGIRLEPRGTRLELSWSEERGGRAPGDLR